MKNTVRRQLLTHLVLIGVCWFAPSAAHAQDNYLEALEEEADTLENLTAAKAERTRLQQLGTAAISRSSRISTAQGGGEPRQNFEQALLAEFPGSYALYLQLSEDHKQGVFQIYADGDAGTGLMRFVPAIDQIIKSSIYQ